MEIPERIAELILEEVRAAGEDPAAGVGSERQDVAD